MTNNFDFSLLNAAGWTEERINDLQKALKLRRQYGYQNLSVGQRRVIIAADAAAVKAEKAASKVKTDKRGLIQNKLHYRWLSFELDLVNAADKLPGEVLVESIILEEQLRSLRELNPVLDTIDAAQRHKLTPLILELRELGNDLGRPVVYDWANHFQQMKAEFVEHWDTRWEDSRNSSSALTEEQSIEFRQLVRAEIAAVSANLWPSVARRLTSV